MIIAANAYKKAITPERLTKAKEELSYEDYKVALEKLANPEECIKNYAEQLKCYDLPESKAFNDIFSDKNMKTAEKFKTVAKEAVTGNGNRLVTQFMSNKKFNEDTRQQGNITPAMLENKKKNPLVM